MNIQNHLWVYREGEEQRDEEMIPPFSLGESWYTPTDYHLEMPT